MKIYIGCDVGTSSTKAVAVDENGKVLAEGSKKYTFIQKHNNWAEQEPDVWLDGAVESIKAVIGQIDEACIERICISALYAGTGAMLDENMNSIRPALIWLDRRAEKESAWAQENLADKIAEVTDNGIDSYFGYIKLLWVKNNEPENWKKLRWVLPANSYIVYRMTGKLMVDYSSAGNFGGIYDYRNHCWSEEMCGLLGIPFETMPTEFCKPYDIVGMINEEFSKKLGLKHEVELCAGTIDCISSMLSANAVKPGDNAAVLGTSLNWGVLHTGLSGDPQIVSMPYAIDPEDISYPYAGASTAGALPRWFVNNFCGGDGAAEYAEIEKGIIDADIPPGSDGLVILPYFMGERSPIWDQNATGVFFGMTLAHKKTHVYHAILEAVGYSLRDMNDSMNLDNERIEKIVLVGGGSRSMIWKQILADIMGLPVLTPINPVEAPLGDAFMAAKAGKESIDFTQISEWIEFNEAVMPNMKKHNAYNEYFKVYKALYENLKDTMSIRANILNDTNL